MGNSNDTRTVSHYNYDCVKWVKVFKNGPGKICGRRPFLEKNWKIIVVYVRSSLSQMFFKTGILKNFAITIRKHLCWSSLFNKISCRPATLSKRDSNTGVSIGLIRTCKTEKQTIFLKFVAIQRKCTIFSNFYLAITEN